MKGDPDCDSGSCNETPQDFKIEEVIAHSDYAKPVAFRNDIALIRLDRPVNKTGTFVFHMKLMDPINVSKLFLKFLLIKISSLRA